MKKKAKISRSRKSRRTVSVRETGVQIIRQGRNPVDALAFLIYQNQCCKPAQLILASVQDQSSFTD